MEHSEELLESLGKYYTLTNDNLLLGLRDSLINYNADLTDVLSWGQLRSKRWLIDELEDLELDLGIVFLCAGWYATLAHMLFDSKCQVNKIRSFDIDPKCANIADTVNKQYIDGWKFKAITEDILNINYTTHTWRGWSNLKQDYSNPITDTPNTIINTSCEHISMFKEWYSSIPKGKLVILQSNNFFDVEEHVNCVEDQDELDFLTPMSDTLYLGTLTLEKYNRYMKIGYK
jgi:hypothetical protein